MKKKTFLLICMLLAAVTVVIGIFMIQKRENQESQEFQYQSFSTPFCSLKYPQQWEERVQVEIQPDKEYTIAAFSGVRDNGTVEPLFDVIFGHPMGTYIGTVDGGNEKSIEVFLKMYDLKVTEDWSDDDIYTLYAMQEDLNVVLEQLPLIEGSASKLVLPSASTQMDVPERVIQTTYGELYYPGRWESFLRVEHVDEKVMFFGVMEGLTEQHLFDVCFQNPEELAVGYLKSEDGTEIPVSISFYELQGTENWSQEQLNMMLYMQEDANYLIDKLNPGTETKAKTVLVEMPVCNLEFPAKWEHYVDVGFCEGDEYKVTFSANLPNKKPVKLFDIVFGNGGEIPVGSLIAKDNTAVAVTFTAYELLFDASWTDEEQDMLYEMAEMVNEVLASLPLVRE